MSSVRRGLILDNLTGRIISTKKCANEGLARREANESIKRLCSKYKVTEADSRFVFYA